MNHKLPHNRRPLRTNVSQSICAYGLRPQVILLTVHPEPSPNPITRNLLSKAQKMGGEKEKEKGVTTLMFFTRD